MVTLASRYFLYFSGHELIQTFFRILSDELHLRARPRDYIAVGIQFYMVIQGVVYTTDIIGPHLSCPIFLEDSIGIFTSRLLYLCRKSGLLFEVLLPVLGIYFALRNIL